MSGIKRFGRRAILGGAAATLALPFFESLLVRGARAADPTPKRLIVVYVPNGIHMPNWTPAMVGPGYDLPPILTPLAPIKSKVNVLTKLANTPGQPDGLGDHAAGTGAFITAKHVKKTEGADIQNGISMDQLAAQVIGPNTRIASMQLGTDGGGSVGDCDSGYSCAYARNISWAGPDVPIPKTVSPQVVFDQIYDGLDPAASAAEKIKRNKYRTSILGYVKNDAKSLRQKLGTSDQKKLDQYLNGVSEVELQIQKAAMGPVCPVASKPPSSFTYPEHVQLMLDLMVLAMQCDVSRVFTFMLGNAGSNLTYDFIGVPEGHHQVSHHQDQQVNFDKITAIDTWEIQQLSYLLQAMDGIPEGMGTMLDNSLVLFSSEIEDGNSHAHHNLPVLLAGSAGGKIQTGRHIVYNDDPMANLFISILNMLDVPVTTFGDNGTAPLVI